MALKAFSKEKFKNIFLICGVISISVSSSNAGTGQLFLWWARVIGILAFVGHAVAGTTTQFCQKKSH